MDIMNLNVTHKISIGFLAMVLFIVVVGSGGLLGNSTIYKRLQHVTDEALPILIGSFNQMIQLQQANQSLFSALAHDDEQEISAEREIFETHLVSFRQILDELEPELARWSELSALLEEIRKLSSYYGSTAHQVIELHRTSLMLKEKVVEEEIRIQGQVDEVTSWAQHYMTNGKSLMGTLAVRGLSRSLRAQRLLLTNYKRSGNITALMMNLESSKGELRRKFKAFAEIESKASQIEALINSIDTQFYGTKGLVSLYRLQHDTIKTLRQQLASTRQQLVLSQSAADAFIERAKGLADHARQEAATSSTLIRTVIIGLSGGSILVALLVAVITINTIRRPLSQIRKLLVNVRNGDLRVEFDQKRKDEFGELGESLNTVVNGLKKILQEIAEGSVCLSEVAQQNAAISLQATQLMSEQSQQLEMTAAAATEMESSVNEVAHHAGSTLDAAEACEMLSHDVNRNVDETIYSIEEQSRAIALAVTVSNELASYSSDIDVILETIHAIAEQTNLLALNAAIEAARAGDHGRGFAVVADEVRELASRTRNSTQKTQEMVENMQSSINQVVTVMQEGYQQAELCVGHANASQQSLTSMSEAISNILVMNTQIAEAAQQQSVAVEEVSRNLTTINTAAAETAQGADQAASSSNELLKLSQLQQSLLQRFTI